MCVAQPGNEVIVPQPVYVTYESVVRATGATLVDVPLRPERASIWTLPTSRRR